MGRISKAIGDGFKDNIVAMFRYGPSTNAAHNMRAVKAVRQERLAKEAAAQRSTHKGGFGDAQHGFVDGRPVTFALGWGNNEGHTLVADGHLRDDALKHFKDHGNHNHYGPGHGPHLNVKDRGRYSGPGA